MIPCPSSASLTITVVVASGCMRSHEPVRTIGTGRGARGARAQLDAQTQTGPADGEDAEEVGAREHYATAAFLIASLMRG